MYNISGYERCCEGKLAMEMATYSSILAGIIPWIEEPGGLSPWGSKESDTTMWLSTGRKIRQVNDDDFSHEIKSHLFLGRKAMTNLDSILKSRDIANKGLYNQSYDFSSRYVWMWEVDHKEGWAQKNWCFWTVVLEKTLESPLDCKEIKPVNPKEINLNIHWKDWWWSWSSNTLATWCEELTH